MSTTVSEISMEPTPALVQPLCVLLVDDIPENLALLEEVLQDQGYETVSANGGNEALQLLREKQIHLIVADAMMPSIDGFQLCKEVKQSKQFSLLPFIIYTGNYVDTEDQTFASSLGVDAYVMKYDGLATLVQSVNTLAQRVYGAQSNDTGKTIVPVETPLPVDEHIFLERHHAIIVKKLEEKMHELEMYAQTLSRKNSEIQASEARYRNLFEHASVGIFVLERSSGRILDINAEGLSLLGFTRTEATAIEPLSFVIESDTAQTILQSGGFFSKETTFRRKDGVSVDVEIGAGPFTEQNNSKILLYALDITEQKRMRQHLIQTEKMAFMGRLAASIAHDIRNPLAAITLNLQYIAKRLPEDFKERSSLNFALEGAQRISKVIENTLSLARITPPKVQPEQINDVIKAAVGFVATACSQKNLMLETNLADDLPLVAIEAKQIEQVLLNLIQNSIDVAPEKSTITVSTCMVEDMPTRASQARKAVAVIILDRGPGISPDAAKHLFEPFRTTKTGGTGLGLALSKQIIDKHNGEIRIEPAVGGGTIARLLFPLNTFSGEEANVKG
jgi:PAS domain S-box-containing protein